MLRQQDQYEVAGLITTVNSTSDQVAVHGTRRALVEMQAEATGLPLMTTPLPKPCSNAEYEQAMRSVCDQALAQGIVSFAFGDLFLADIRQYREGVLQGTGVEPLFPLWEYPTDKLAREMVASGLRAKLVCIDPKRLSPDFAGRDFDQSLLDELPPAVDPCGERGEFHTFAYAGPMFSRQLPIVTGEKVERDGFWFCDVHAASSMP